MTHRFLSRQICGESEQFFVPVQFAHGDRERQQLPEGLRRRIVCECRGKLLLADRDGDPVAHGTVVLCGVLRVRLLHGGDERQHDEEEGDATSPHIAPG